MENELVFTSTRAASHKTNDYITDIYISASIATLFEHHSGLFPARWPLPLGSLFLKYEKK